ncbi:hypothetical protein ACGFJ7_45975 [Actinoplanes sp. NPDC048988]|uniref:hypothetical protein n=1 Tax=Actinoplanes sp. NPDC048988 TaxID=3363901 RepID=UPI003711146C
MEIDHIIPRTISPARLQQLIELHGLAADFDLNALSNLAPICGACNTEKSNRDDVLDSPRFALQLVEARRLASVVERRVREHTGGNAVTRLLTDAAMADLGNTGARQAFLEHAPGIVQKLALIDPSAADFLSSRDVPLDLEYDHVVVRATLNARGRTTVAVVEELCDFTLPQAIGPAVRQLITATRESVTKTLMGMEHVYGFAYEDGVCCTGR